MTNIKWFIRNNWKWILSAIFIIIIIGLAIYACTYRKTETVIVQARWWRYSLAVKYDTTTTEIECVTEQRCTGAGDTRMCRTERNCRPETTTTTHTRCRNYLTGETLPAQRPSLPCNMYYGDYLSESVDYFVNYRITESDTTKQAKFGGEIWQSLEPGAMVKITLTAWSWITKAEVVK